MSLAITLGIIALLAALMFNTRRPKLPPTEARRLVQEGATLLDVRTESEFAGGHLPGAHNVPVQELSGRLREIQKNQPVVVYCHSGSRATVATRLLRKAGFEVRDLGAMSNWPRT